MRAFRGERVLIIPLHKPLTAATFPVVTAILILLNCFVFLFLQGGDDAVLERAAKHFRESGLAKLEVPAFVQHLERGGEHEMAVALEQIPEPARSQWTLRAIQSDAAFQRALAGDAVFKPGDEHYPRWRELRTRLERIWAERFTDRFLLRYSEIDPVRLVGSMFLHGGLGHLLGNMLFLALLGLLVEGALGPWLFLAVYLLGGIGGSSIGLARHWGELGGALGASGAIAALMGAFCVLWGLRKVRFFWWFFVAFDYVKAPALLLLPAWLGWELFNMWANPDAGVGFDAHAGGIVSGALLALAVRRAGWERRAFMDEEEQRDAAAAACETAMSALGRLEFRKARELLAPLATQRPGDPAILVPLYRCWRAEPAAEGFHAAARDALLGTSVGRGEQAQVVAVWTDYLAATSGEPRLAPAELVAFARRCIAWGAVAEAEKVLEVASHSGEGAGVPEAAFELALVLRERQQRAAYVRLLQHIVARFPSSPHAQKSRFLLENS